MKKFAPWLLVLSLFVVTGFAREADQLPANYLAGMGKKFTHPTAQINAKRGNIPTPFGFPAGVDTISNFTGHFEAQGVGLDGLPHQMWEYSMVGGNPAIGGTTTYNAPVVPVTMDLRNADGSPRFVVNQFGQSVPLISRPDAFIQPFLNSPVFQNSTYSSSNVPTQFTDAVHKAEFGAQARPNWHTLLAPSLKQGQTMVLRRGTYQFALNDDGTCCLFILVSDPVFSSKLFPPSTPDNSTVIGAAEVAGDITTKDISTFMFPNVYLFDPNNGNCCVLGFHSFDFEVNPANGQLQFFIVNYSSWISPGLFDGGFEDVTAHSHEIAETFDDPFVGFDNVHNITPWWQNDRGQCQPIMETGDVIEDGPNPTYPVTINGFTYHPQTEALLPWFEFQKNSQAIDHAYSYPDETALTHLSARQPFACGQQ